MITSKIKTRHWFPFIVLVVALVLFPIVLALAMGEQYHVVPEEFQLVFYGSMVMSVVLLIIGILYLERLRRKS